MRIREAYDRSPISALMQWFRAKQRTPQSPRNPDKEMAQSVGCGVAAGETPTLQPATATIGDDDRRILLEMARSALVCAAADPASAGREIPAAGLSARLTERQACFVTLTENGALKGCMGQIQPLEPLFRAVIHNTRNAATRDPRFPPVTSAEASRIRIEVNVLSRMRELKFTSPEDLLDQLRPLQDGVVLNIGSRRSTFLPKVWDMFPDKIQFLNRLSEKAGCRPSAWRDPGVSISVYETEVFGE